MWVYVCVRTHTGKVWYSTHTHTNTHTHTHIHTQTHTQKVQIDTHTQGKVTHTHTHTHTHTQGKFDAAESAACEVERAIRPKLVPTHAVSLKLARALLKYYIYRECVLYIHRFFSL